MNRKIIAALIVWLCVGFNSAADVTQFLNMPNLLKTIDTRDAKVVAMPLGTTWPEGPAYEVFFPMKSSVISLPNNAVACAP